MPHVTATGFNSMIVRLKAMHARKRQPRHRKFQFYDSPIKRVFPETENRVQRQGFNSMIVRLKVKVTCIHSDDSQVSIL